MTHLDSTEIKRIRVHPVMCRRCKLTGMIKPDDEVCSLCELCCRKYRLGQESLILFREASTLGLSWMFRFANWSFDDFHQPFHL